MKHTIPLCALLVGFALLASAYAQNKPASLPELPEVLKSANAALADRKPVGLTLSVDSKTPLSAAQWDAIATLRARAFSFGGSSLDDAGMARLVALNPEMVTVNGSLVTGAGAAKFGEMKSLKALHTLHITKPTPEAKAALGAHPTLEVFSSDGAFCIEAVTAPKLQRVDLKHGAASDQFVALLKNHPSLESVRLWAKGYATLSDAAIASLVTIPKLNKLSLEFSVFTYAGGLNRLKEIPGLATLDLKDVALSPEDLAKLKADLPKVKLTFTPMTPEYRAQWDAWATKKK
ncbi:MAG: hypothetical protein EB141_15400 [Verrucomicrobia bacterium]|nr:hypothetical protein [Pseudomonadota bacterium]NDA68640.1 hypothetical protein [Verrucomicrobiota bacterium]NDB77001.1 hypothetical protein [Verrucomicrobiota bacterium]NDD40416.1 hypothetical protein [Verrucomicrobiota bacterium]NDE97477.1 hypothetical protein [Verrucomicrobiota bacterium]